MEWLAVSIGIGTKSVGTAVGDEMVDLPAEDGHPGSGQ